jgi:hypothetical protein
LFISSCSEAKKRRKDTDASEDDVLLDNKGKFKDIASIMPSIVLSVNGKMQKKKEKKRMMMIKQFPQ